MEEDGSVADGGDVTLDDATAGDGGLPGGMSPDQLSQLMQNPEMMALLSNPRLQVSPAHAHVDARRARGQSRAHRTMARGSCSVLDGPAAAGSWQDVMKQVMEKGPAGVDASMMRDPETKEVLQKLQSLLGQ